VDALFSDGHKEFLEAIRRSKSMQTTKLLISMLMVAGLGAIPASSIGAADPLSPAAPQPPARQCEAKMVLLGKTVAAVKIEAGPGSLSNTLAEEFPFSETCPSGLCSKWEYRWTVQTPGVTLERVLISVDSDVTIQSSNSAGATVVKSLPGFFAVDTDGERFIRFPASGTSFTASFSTPANAGPGTLTAAFVGKKGALPVFARCAIAGADNLIPEPKQAVNKEFVSLAGPCTVTRTVDGFERTISMTVTGPTGCEFAGLKKLGLEDGSSAVHISGETQITAVMNPTLYCWPSTTTGKMTCARIP
jgi:hypothetical protein